MDYLGRYSHRVAISNDRLTELKDGRVSFIYKDYKHENRLSGGDECSQLGAPLKILCIRRRVA